MTQSQHAELRPQIDEFVFSSVINSHDANHHARRGVRLGAQPTLRSWRAPLLAGSLAGALDLINGGGDKGAALHRILEAQAYRIAFWRVSSASSRVSPGKP